MNYLDYILNGIIALLVIIPIILIYSTFRIYFITREIKRTGTLKEVGYFEYLIRNLINEDIHKRHENPSKKAD